MRPIILSLLVSLSAAVPTSAAYNLHVTSHAGPATMHGGEKPTYVVTVVNDGPDPSPVMYVAARPNTTINGVPAAAKESVAGSSSKTNNGTTGCTTSFYGGICRVSSLAAGASITGTFVMAAPAALGDVTPATVTVTGETGIFASDGSSIALDSRNVVTDVTLLTDASLDATAPSSITTSDTLSFVVNVHNPGPSIGRNASVTWGTPPGTTFVSLAQSTVSGNIVQPFNCTTPAVGGTGTVTCTRDPLYVDGTPYTSTEPTTLTFAMKAPSNAGTMTNSATITTSTPDKNAANDSVSKDTTVVAPNADLAVTNTPAVTDPVLSTRVDVTIKVRNNGPTISSSTVLSFDTTGGTISPSVGCTQTVPVKCTIGTLNPGQTLTFTMGVSLPATLGPITTTASIPARAEDSVPANDTAKATFTVSPPQQANLIVALDLPASVSGGTTFDVPMRVTNSGPRDAINVLTQQSIDGGGFNNLELTGVTSPTSGATCFPNGSYAVCRLGTLPIGATLTAIAHLTLKSGASGALSVTGSASSDYPGGTTARGQISIAGTPSPDLAVALQANAPPGDGTVSLYVTVSNHGLTAATTELVEIPLPSGLRVVDDSVIRHCWDATLPGWRCPLDGLPPSTGTTFPFTVAGTSDVVMTARVVAPNDPNQSNNGTSLLVHAGIPSADVGVSVSGPAQALSGGTSTYTATVTNNGPAAAPITMVSLTLQQANITGLRQTSGPAAACNVSSCTINSLASGSSATFEFGVNPTAKPTQTFTVTATTTVSNATDPNSGNNTAKLTGVATGLHADLAGAITVDKAAVAPGGTVTYTFTGTNRGPDPASAITLALTTQDGAALLSATAGSVPCDVTTVVACHIASLDPNASVVLTALVKAPPSIGTLGTQAQFRSATTYDPDDSNNNVHSIMLVTGTPAQAQLTPELIAPAAAPAMGTMTLVATIRDAGATVTNPRLTFTPPAGSTVDAIVQSGGVTFTCEVINSSAVCSAPSLAIGDSATFTLTVHVGANSGRFAGVLSATSDTASGSTSVDVPIVVSRRRSGPR